MAAALGAGGNQQGDTRFGDIRFSAIPQNSGVLGSTVLPPPINGGSDAGDIILNSTASWQINSNYDLESVALHELGHALGLGHSQLNTAVMYAYYHGVDQTLSTDDTSGMQAVYGPRQFDQFNSGGKSNGTYSRAANINAYIDGNAQVAIPRLDISTLGQSEWFYVTVPASSTGTMVATVQSSNLSSLSPKITVMTTSLQTVGSQGSSNLGDTVSVSVAVQPGQSYYVRANANSTGTALGGFGLELNFGSHTQSPISPPYTVVPPQPDQGGGTIGGPTTLGAWEKVSLGSLSAWVETLTTDSGRNHLPGNRGFDQGSGGINATALLSCMVTYACTDGDSSQSFSTGPGGVTDQPAVDVGHANRDTLPIPQEILDTVLATWKSSSSSLLSAD